MKERLVKSIIGMSCLICLFVLQPAMAELPVTISDPSPAIGAVYNVGDSATIIYTITNNVMNRSFPLTVSGISNPLSRTTVSNDCNNSLPKGPSTCSIGIQITPTTEEGGKSLNQNLMVNYQGRTPLVKNIAFSVPQPSAVLTAAGYTMMGLNPDSLLLAVSYDGLGATWTLASIIGSLPNFGVFNATSCTGSGATAICIAAGQNISDNTGLLVQSMNGGVTWAITPILGLPSNSIFYSSSCSGSGATAICVAGGASGNAVILAQSTNGGATWIMHNIAGLLVGGRLNAASCSGSGVTGVCVAAGGSNQPLLVQSTDGGATWAAKSITGIPALGIFSAASCTGSGPSAICIAAGQYFTGSAPPLLAQSTDGGANWAVVQSISGLPATGEFASTSCTGSGPTAICIAAGESGNPGIGPPLLAQSTDGGAHWAVVQSIPDLPPVALFLSASCTGSGSAAICIAAGQNETSSFVPFLVQSTDGGVTWAIQPILGLTTIGIFHGSNCTGNGATAICIATGQDLTGSFPPLLAQSTNGGRTWAVKSVVAAPSVGNFATAGATGGSQALSRIFSSSR
jgi:hypothetical protein